ncbi:hypothetical protein [Mycolicibacterium sp. CR10]|uniref:hypothetical protein n=1 Tax=Mycolicibacterium sp. CR10 TaxID=2562314 RepID=UPI0010C02131|nr:hypothetical protein [Mycolicibacterium sp. CR10]
MTTEKLLQPDPESLEIAYHPSYSWGDLVGIGFTDAATGQHHRMVLRPEVAHELSTLLATVVSSPKVTFLADQMKAHQREQL